MFASTRTKEEKNQQYKYIYSGEYHMVTGLKPTWQNLKGSGFASKNPVIEMVGQMVDWQLVANNFSGNNIEFKFSQCQILNSEGLPYPYADWTMSIKFSDSENSGWGIFGKSVAESLGIDIELMDIDLLKGRWCHILQSPHEFGEDTKADPDPITGLKPKIVGQVFRLVEFIQQGQAVTQMSAVQAIVTPAPVQVVAPPIAVAPVPIVNVVAPIVPVAVVPVDGNVPIGVVATMAAPTAVAQTAEQIALGILHGKDKATFFKDAIPHPVIRADAALTNTILSNAFTTAKVASGEVILNADSTHTVVGM